MFHVVLHEPEIPPNTGNVIRLCANTGARLHLIEPLGFALSHSKLRRAGLDYHEWARLEIHPSFVSFQLTVRPQRIFTLSTRHTMRYDDVRYAPGDAFVFGSETRGLPEAVRNSVPGGQRLYVPMQKDSRSLNLSNAVAVVVYEAWRQSGFAGSAQPSTR